MCLHADGVFVWGELKGDSCSLCRGGDTVTYRLTVWVSRAGSDAKKANDVSWMIPGEVVAGFHLKRWPGLEMTVLVWEWYEFRCILPGWLWSSATGDMDTDNWVIIRGVYCASEGVCWKYIFSAVAAAGCPERRVNRTGVHLTARLSWHVCLQPFILHVCTCLRVLTVQSDECTIFIYVYIYLPSLFIPLRVQLRPE